ncbi:hypothetical protein ERJ75_000368500 [Trypanosoma vivax]|nr:hypothetical protein ERJ75_000368500 [Trypanosoma vivax]
MPSWLPSRCVLRLCCQRDRALQRRKPRPCVVPLPPRVRYFSQHASVVPRVVSAFFTCALLSSPPRCFNVSFASSLSLSALGPPLLGCCTQRRECVPRLARVVARRDAASKQQSAERQRQKPHASHCLPFHLYDVLCVTLAELPVSDAARFPAAGAPTAAPLPDRPLRRCPFRGRGALTPLCSAAKPAQHTCAVSRALRVRRTMVPRPLRPSCVGRDGRGRDVRGASGPVWRSPVGKCLRDGSLSVVRSRVHSKCGAQHRV